MVDIKDYFITLEEVIKEKNLENFWIICGQKKFKPLNITKEDIQKMLKENIEEYRGKYLARITFIFFPLKQWDVIER